MCVKGKFHLFKSHILSGEGAQMQASGSLAAAGPTTSDKIWASCPTEVARSSRLEVAARGWKLYHN